MPNPVTAVAMGKYNTRSDIGKGAGFSDPSYDCRQISLITGPPNGPVLFCSLASFIVCRRL